MAEHNIKVNNKPYSVIIEGNIGSGKTTLINYLRDAFNANPDNGALILEEPVDKWVNHKGVNLLVSCGVRS